MGHQRNSFSGEPEKEEEIDDTFPPISATTPMKTTKPNLSLRAEISDELWEARQWGVRVMSTGDHTEDDAWHKMVNPDGTLGSYHQSEMELWREDDGIDDDNDSGGDDDGSGDDSPLVPKDNPHLVLIPA